jgi:hypothetical protein
MTIAFFRLIEIQDIPEFKKILETENMKEQTLSSGIIRALDVYNDKNKTFIVEIINELIKYLIK